MELTHEFTVPASVEDTWRAFNDLEMVAGCFPGATLTSVDGDEFRGSCKVKLGPIALVYSGAGTFLERDGGAHRFVIEAKGKDKRGNGTAGATVTAVLTAAGAAVTTASVTTDLSITGKPAQFGRGVIQDVSDKLLGQFVACLESKVGGGEQQTTAAEQTAPAEVVEPPGEVGPATTGPRGGVSEAPTPSPATREQTREDDALDLGATVVPVLLKAYWRPLAGAALVLLVLRRLVRRRR